MKLYKTETYTRVEKKFFKKHQDLLDRYAFILKELKKNPFSQKLKTHKLKGDLSEFYACSLTHKYRIIMIIKIENDKIILVNIGNHDEVY